MKPAVIKLFCWFGLAICCLIGASTFASIWFFLFHAWGFLTALLLGWLPAAIVGIICACAVAYAETSLAVAVIVTANLRPRAHRRQ